jgi:hypothetical protein
MAAFLKRFSSCDINVRHFLIGDINAPSVRVSLRLKTNSAEVSMLSVSAWGVVLSFPYTKTKECPPSKLPSHPCTGGPAAAELGGGFGCGPEQTPGCWRPPARAASAGEPLPSPARWAR